MEIRTRNSEKISIERIYELEMELEVKFPVEYVEFIKNNNSARIRPKHFKVGPKVESINNFHNINERYHFKDDRLPKDIVPFARDAGDNQICFDLRVEGKASVLFWDYEIEYVENGALSFVAKSFESFLDSLFEFEE